MNIFAMLILFLCYAFFLYFLCTDIDEKRADRVLFDIVFAILLISFSFQEIENTTKDRREKSVICTEQPSDSISVKKGGEV